MFRHFFCFMKLYRTISSTHVRPPPGRKRTTSLLAFFARVRGIADCNEMSGNLNKAKEDFLREMNTPGIVN